MRLWRDSAANWKASSENRKASSENRKVFSEESEGFFRRALGSYIHKFPKRGEASLMYLPRSRLDLPRSRLGLPHLRFSRNSSPATEGFLNRSINFKDAYRMYTPKRMTGQERQTRQKASTQTTLFDDRVTTLDTSMVGDAALLTSLNKSLLGIAGPNSENKPLYELVDGILAPREMKHTKKPTPGHTILYPCHLPVSFSITLIIALLFVSVLFSVVDVVTCGS